ncbi:MAG: hypothetical protein OWQ54_09165 [Sulfolobaceae archaeon]|nr:hypothetical protein [Sulfolobaceae archaeon]
MNSGRRLGITVIFLIFLLLILILSSQPISDVLYFYKGKINVSNTIVLSASNFNSPYCLGSMNVDYGFYRTLYAYTIEEHGYYVLNQTFTTLKLNAKGNLSFSLRGNTLANAFLYIYNSNNSFLLPEDKELLLYPGVYNVSEVLYFNSTKFPQTLNGQLNFSINNAVYYVYSIEENVIPPPTGNYILNLFDGQSVFGYILYQGYLLGEPTNSYPALKSLQFLIPQPYLMFQTAQFFVSGLVITNEPRYNGNSITVQVIGTFSEGYYPYADGFTIGLFLTPGKGKYSYSNFSIPYYYGHGSVNRSFPQLGGFGPVSPIQGALIFPYSTTPYLIVQWDPYWQTGYKGYGGGQFNVFIVSYSSPNKPPEVINYTATTGYTIGIGNGVFQPSPYDLICFRVTYFSNGTIIAKVIDLNTGQSDSLVINIPTSLFQPSPGSYWTFVEGSTGVYYANWGIISWSIS